MLIVTFIGNLGEAAIDENQAITTANGGVGETELTTLTPELIFDFNQVKKSYDAKEYSKAFKEAKALAVEGDADAQLYLGKMFADGVAPYKYLLQPTCGSTSQLRTAMMKRLKNEKPSPPQ